MNKTKKVVKKKNPIEDKSHWYSPVYEMNDMGFYISKHENNYYFGYTELSKKDKSRRCLEVKINYDTFKVLKGEWKQK